MLNNKILVSLLLIICATSGWSQKGGSTELRTQIDSILNGFHLDGKFNGCALVMKNDKELINKAYGHSGAKEKNDLTPNHQFGIGSIYKEFPAVLIMSLHEKGKISLKASIKQFIPDLPAWAKPITVMHLLNYSSGLPTIDWNKYFSQGLAISEKNIMDDLLALDSLEFHPGTDYLYTNYSPYLLIKIIEKVGGSEFSKLIQDEILTPLKMNNTHFKKQFPYQDANLMAMPFNSEFEVDKYAIDFSSMLLTTTTKDLYLWFKNLNTYKIIDRNSVLTLAKTADLKIENMQAPLGNCSVENREIIEHVHHGGMGNYEGLVSRNNKEDLTIVVLTNQKNKNVFEMVELISNRVLEKQKSK